MVASRDLPVRAASAAVLLPLVIGAVLWESQRWAFSGLCLLVSLVALGEFAALALPLRPWRERATVVLVGGGLAAVLYLFPALTLAAVMAAVIAVAFVQLFGVDDMPTAGARFGLSLAGVFYLGSLVVALPSLQRDVAHGALWVIVAMGLTFSNDTGAYFVGRALGHHKLAPAVSPGKTVEGLAGGLGASLLFVFVSRSTFFPALGVLDCVLLGLGASVFGPVGDLLESLLKRSAGVKDSGRLIPGHGGILDRIDALLFVGAFVYVYARFLH